MAGVRAGGARQALTEDHAGLALGPSRVRGRQGNVYQIGVLRQNTVGPIHQPGDRFVRQRVGLVDDLDGRALEGLAQLPESSRLVHHLYFEYPNWKHKAPIEELYVDVETNLPAAAYLRYKSGRLDAAYIYDDVNADVSLTDDDFLLEVERDAGASEATPAGKES